MNLKHIILTLLVLSFCWPGENLRAAEIMYPVSAIPAELKKDAKAVVRVYDTYINLTQPDKQVKRVKYAVTILNKNGLSESVFYEYYDKTTKVSSIRARLFDEFGNDISKKSDLDVLDYAINPNGSAYDDRRSKIIDPDYTVYPFTIEYTYEVSYTGQLQFSGWIPVSDLNISVQKSVFSIDVAKNANFRFFERNLITPVTITEHPEVITHSWTLTDFAALSNENFSPSIIDYTPVVRIAPSNINLEGYRGNIETWKGFGQWIYQLNEGRNNLTSESKLKISKLTEGITDEKAKIKILYEYMQNKTRYVNIKIGIGGFQPIDAETVDRLSYGDCKALSNYMVSLLETIGIKARYTLIHAGEENPHIFEEFPSNQFNHAIVCVPLKTDTVWLECTSQQCPFNYMGTFTADRKALVIDENGGTLVQTPVLNGDENLVSRKINVSLDQNGDGPVRVKTLYNGAAYDQFAAIYLSDQADRKTIITGRIHIPNFELETFDLQEKKSEQPCFTEKLEMYVSNYTTRVGDRIMLTLNMMSKLNDSPFQADVRKTNIAFTWPSYRVDTVCYQLPVGYTLEKIPATVSLKSEFGEYTTEVSKTGEMLQYIRTFRIFKGEYPVEKYEEIVSFFEKVIKADDSKVLLSRKL